MKCQEVAADALDFPTDGGRGGIVLESRIRKAEGFFFADFKVA